ncbi:MAG TPA: tetratricopeptide repeat protein [Pyrinomonadaceae bacterium]|nr:tetratricopeptide repeat protein [Pyrinomonadaceae bacterium]
MKIFFSLSLLVCLLVPSAPAQTQTAPAVWLVTLFDINANVQQAERTISIVAGINATNVGGSPSRTMTVRLNSKASVKSVTAGGAATTFRPGVEARGDLQRIEIALPSAATPGTATSVSVTYTLPVETNSGLAAISPIGTQFLPLSFWYPMPNTPYTQRGGDTAPFRVTVNIGNAIASGVEKNGAAGSITFEQSLLHGQPFFLQGDWDKLEGAAEGKGIAVLLEKGVPAEERKRAEALIAFTAAARSFFAASLGPAPDAPVRIVSVRRGAGFNDSGTVLIDADTLRLPKIDAATALSVAETVARLWVGGQTAVRAEGSGVLRDALVRFLATQFLEKQFGREAVLSELYRQRLAYAAVAQRDAPLARSNQIDSTYFGSVPNRGAMFWRLLDKRMGRDALMGVLRAALESGKKDGLTLAALREALAARGGDPLRALMDQQLDQVVDTDLMVGLPTQRQNGDWVSALRNIGSTDVTVAVAATTERGERLIGEATIPAKNFGEAVFKTPAKIVRVEVDPDKLYPQLDYGNDAVPRSKDLPDALNEASLQLGAQDFAKAEATARAMLATAPRFQEAKILLGRSLLGQNKLEEAETLFRSSLEEPLPSTATLAWANIGLGEISLKRGQAAEAAKRFGDAVAASRDYPSSLAARAARIRAETAANNAPVIDDAARAFITQFSQAVVSNKKPDLDSRVVSGELVRFINASIGTEVWETRVLRTEQLNANLIAADVFIKANKLGKAGEGTAVMMLTRTPSGLKLSGIELFEVR